MPELAWLALFFVGGLVSGYLVGVMRCMADIQRLIDDAIARRR